MKINNFISGIVGVALVVALTYTWLTKNELSTQLTYKDYELESEIIAHHKADSINSLYLAKIDSNDIVINRLELSYAIAKQDVDNLKKQLNTTLDSIDKEVPYDSSYAYLQKKYAFEGEEKYPFNGPQVKQFHKLDVQRNWDLKTITRLDLVVKNADNLIATKDTTISYYDKLYTTCMNDKTSYKYELVRMTGDYNIIKDKLHKTKLTKNIVSGGLAVFIGIEVLKIIF